MLFRGGYSFHPSFIVAQYQFRDYFRGHQDQGYSLNMCHVFLLRPFHIILDVYTFADWEEHAMSPSSFGIHLTRQNWT